jgi:arginyl-tRNA synthetase
MNQMVTFVQGGQAVKLSKRSGKALTLDELIEDFGADVVRYFFIMRSANTQFEFDMDLAREQSDKNPVFYLQYAHARIAGVLRHAESVGATLDGEASLAPLVEEEELALIKEILSFPEAVRRSARDLEPQIIAEYLRGLAAAFHKFYHEHRIVIDDVPLRNARMRLLDATKTTLGNGLRVLGLGAPERM